MNSLQRARAEVLTATWLSYAGYYLCRKVFSTVKVPIAEALGRRDSEVAHLWTAFLMAYVAGQFLSAWLGQRTTGRRIVLWGMAATVLSGAAVGTILRFATARWCYPALLVTLALHGVAQATGWPGLVGLLAAWTQRAERGLVMSVWGTCYVLGAVAARALAAFLLGHLGLSWSFFGTSLITGLFWLAFLRFAHESPGHLGLHLPDEPEVASAASSPVAPITHVTIDRQRLLQRAFAIGVLYFCFKFVRYALDSWSALLLHHHFRLAATMAGYLSTAFDLAGLFGVLGAGWLSDRFAPHQRSLVIFGMSAGMLLATVLLTTLGVSSLPGFLIGLGLVGLLIMGPDALLSGPTAIELGDRRTAVLAVGVINGLGSIGPIVQEPLIGWLLDYRGIPAVLRVLVAATAIATLGTWFLWQYERRRAAAA